MVKKLNLTTKQICIDGVMSALYVVISMFLSFKIGKSMEITFDGLIIILTAFMFGLSDALFVAFVGEFIVQLINYGLSITMPFWMLASLSRALICGLYAKANNFKFKTSKLVIVIIVSSLIQTAFNTLAMYFDALLLGYLTTKYLQDTVLGLLIIRILSSVITAVLFSVAVPLILPRLQKMGIAKRPNDG